MTNPKYVSEDEIIKILFEIPSDDESIVDDSDDDPDFVIETNSENILGYDNGETSSNNCNNNKGTNEQYINIPETNN